MPQVINTNIASLTAQRNLNKSQGDLRTALQRLSSGLRINSAKDDAAGLAISERFTSQIRGLNQAMRNANDGISLAQTAEGALGEINNNLQRIRELAVQSANATNSASDRAALNQEVQQRLQEVNRVAKQTAFNGLKVLDGSFSNAQFQVGANVGQVITIDSIASAKTSDLGTGDGYKGTGGAVTADLVAGDLTINGNDVGAVTGDAKEIAAAISTADPTVTATANATTVTGAAATSFTATTDDIAAGDLKINGVDVSAITAAGSAPAQGTAVANAINLITAQTGVTASADAAGLVTLTAADGRNIEVAQSGTATTARTGLTAATKRSTITLESANAITVGGANAGNAGLSGFTAAAATVGSKLDQIDVTSVPNANKTIQAVDFALQTINSTRATLGAVQNRFDSTIATLSTTTENLSAARSRIQDADFAQETAALTRAQILQQAGTSVLQQANALPQNVLTLLR